MISLPEDKSEGDKVRRNAPRFWLSEVEKLYKCSFSKPYLLCIHPEVSSYSLRSYIKGFVEAIQEVDLYLIEPSLRAIGGQICKKMHKNM